MDDTKKLPIQWAQENNIHVMDPDGWRNEGRPWNEPVTETEFHRLLSNCTYSQGSQR